MKFTKDRYFIDTNVLVYANDSSNQAKRERSREIIAHAYTSRLGCLSTQVLQEFFMVATQKVGIAQNNARAQVLKLTELDTVLVDADVIVKIAVINRDVDDSVIACRLNSCD